MIYRKRNRVRLSPMGHSGNAEAARPSLHAGGGAKRANVRRRVGVNAPIVIDVNPAKFFADPWTGRPSHVRPPVHARFARDLNLFSQRGRLSR